ncbi:hypothetical protein PFICI_03362 [Pestalotiopsis fici W106-1]|uniref:Uncharacterized protein n=1 Tax=Pestalotiopsis fici (strain W106-1 / CGMCC3.15140) TaxID=1229662 RepID=W3XIS9_PESFW|nr:uncharacterized protein PFICI_03362 [Pestalotiopsis fici W106-1]ETS85337.1 hypothetical protein PFICI_03362 [Pestalotiopsis fici W106-1]
MAPATSATSLLERTATLALRATTTTAASTATATSINWGEQFAWPPSGKSLPFWLAIFIICPVIFVGISWIVWECKYGSPGNDDVLKALREKRKEMERRDKIPVYKPSAKAGPKITTAQIGAPKPVVIKG